MLLGEADPRPLRRLLAISATWRAVCIVALLAGAQVQQAFDTSGSLLHHTLWNDAGVHAWNRWAVPFVRWDSVYFVSVAARGASAGGYEYEQMLAFQPGIIAVLRAAGWLGLDGRWSGTAAVLGTVVLANLATMVAPLILYYFSVVHGGHTLAYRAAFLSIFAPVSSTALGAPTPEPFYSFFTLAGLAALAPGKRRKTPDVGLVRLTLATLAFAAATCFRTNGLLLAGFLVWRTAYIPALRAPVRNAQRFFVRVLLSLPFVAAMCMPHVLFQAWAYARLCPGRPWCASRIPNVYGFVQSHYWNVGFLRYWEALQLPNFALAAPVLITGFVGCVAYCRRHSLRELVTLSVCPGGWAPIPADLWLLPFVVHTFVLLMLLLLVSHVQIALRFATPGGLPFLWWTYGSARRPEVVLYALIAFNAAASVLYAGFYPPA